MRNVTTPGSAFLRALIEAKGGSISVERFMREALYHPRFGYYARQVDTVGKGGDFSTSATLHPALARAVAAWACARRTTVVRRGAWHLIELGAGTGHLAAEILRAIPWWRRRGLRYHIVEVSAGLRAAQQRRLRPFGCVVRWHPEVRPALAEAAGCALFVSNEFVDAFPCVQLAHGLTPGNWQEVRIGWPPDAENPDETFADWRGEVPDAGDGTEFAVGQRVEVHLSYRRWLEEELRGWNAGHSLTIDYGARPPGLYHRRTRGTLRAYFRHQRIAGPELYQRFGQQDLTADVNFADLMRWGEALGLGSVSLSTQAEFLQRWLPPRLQRRWGNDAAFAFLLDPEGAGSAFKVLEQIRRTART